MCVYIPDNHDSPVDMLFVNSSILVNISAQCSAIVKS